MSRDPEHITVEGISGWFRPDHYCVVGTNMLGKKVVIKNERVHPSHRVMAAYRKAWPRGITLYYCDTTGSIEYICD